MVNLGFEARAWQTACFQCVDQSLRMLPSHEHGASRRMASKLSGTSAPISRPSITVTSGGPFALQRRETTHEISNCGMTMRHS